LNIKSNQIFTKQPNTRSHENSTENSELTGSASPFCLPEEQSFKMLGNRANQQSMVQSHRLLN